MPTLILFDQAACTFCLTEPPDDGPIEAMHQSLRGHSEQMIEHGSIYIKMAKRAHAGALIHAGESVEEHQLQQ